MVINTQAWVGLAVAKQLCVLEHLWWEQGMLSGCGERWIMLQPFVNGRWLTLVAGVIVKQLPVCEASCLACAGAPPTLTHLILPCELDTPPLPFCRQGA